MAKKWAVQVKFDGAWIYVTCGIGGEMVQTFSTKKAAEPLAWAWEPFGDELKNVRIVEYNDASQDRAVSEPRGPVVSRRSVAKSPTPERPRRRKTR